MCLDQTPEVVGIISSGGRCERKSLLDKLEEAVFKEQSSNSHSSISVCKASASHKERMSDVNEPSPSVQPFHQNDSSAATEAVPNKIVLKLSSSTVVPDQKPPQHKAVKLASVKNTGSGKREGGKTKIPAKDTGLLLNQAVEFKGTSLEKDTAAAPGVKQQSKVKKRRNPQSEGNSSRHGSSTQTLAVDKIADFSANQLSEYVSASSDKGDSVAPFQKPLAKVNCQTAVKYEGHGTTADSSNAEMTVTDKATDLPSKRLHEHKKLPSADAVCAPGQKSKVKKRVGSNSEDRVTKNITNMKVTASDKGADFHSNLPECRKLSFEGDGTGLSKTKAKKPVSSNTEVCGTADSDSTSIPEILSFNKSADFSRNKPAKCKKPSSDSRRNERPKFAGGKPNSGLGQGTNPCCVTSQFAGGHFQGPQPTENATKTSVPKAEKADSGPKITKEATSGRRSNDSDVQNKHKCHKRSLSDPQPTENATKTLVPKMDKTNSGTKVTKDATSGHRPDDSDAQNKNKSLSDPSQTVHHQQKYGAAADSLSYPSQHPEIQYQQRRTSDCLEPHTESAAVDSRDGFQAEKPEGRVLSSGASGSANCASEHQENIQTQKCASQNLTDQVESVAVEFAEAEKPKSKVVSLADYKKRKSEPSTSTPTAVSLSSTAKIGEGDARCMTSSLAEQLIVSYTSRTKADGHVYECVPLPKSLHSSEFMNDDDVLVRQDVIQSETVGDMCNFQSLGQQSVWPPTQHQRGAAVFNTVDGSALSSRYGTRGDQFVPKQMHADNFSGDSKYPRDCDVAKMIEKESVYSSSNLPLEAVSFEKTNGLFEIVNDSLEPAVSRSHSCHDNDKGKTRKGEPDSCGKDACNIELPAVVSSHEITTKLCEPVSSNSDAGVGFGDVLEDYIVTMKREELPRASDSKDNSSKVNKAGGDIGPVSLLSQTVVSDVNVQDDSQSASVNNQGTAAESGLNVGSYTDSNLKFTASVAVTNLDDNLATKTEEHTNERAIPSSDAAGVPFVSSKCTLNS